MARIVPDKTAGESVGAQLDMFSPLPAGARVSVTHDNGTEFAHHERLRDGLGMATYFADPYSSWQRGSNENRNGMIRRYLPKRCEIRMDMAKEVREIVDEINNRPMRVLGYRTPAEAFADELLTVPLSYCRCIGELEGAPPFSLISRRSSSAFKSESTSPVSGFNRIGQTATGR